jgi:hypothetical protein
VVYRNRGNGGFDDVTDALGEPVTIPRAGRAAAFADLNNDGDIDVVVNNVHDRADLFRSTAPAGNNWLMLKLVGKTSNRSAIGARVRLVVGNATQSQEVRGGGSYYAQNDLRLHFGLGTASRVDRVDVRWPNGLRERWMNVEVNKVHVLTEGTGTAGSR